jgi:small-conductance mechanosensitive channel
MELSEVSIEILKSLGIIFASFILAGILSFVLSRYVSKITRLTKTTIDDEIFRVIKKAIPVGVILVGLYLGLVSLSLLAPYSSQLRDLFTIIIVLFSAYMLVKIVNITIKWYSEEIAFKTGTRPDEQFLPIFRKITSIFIYFIAFIIIIDSLDIEISPFIATLGVGGIAVALALQESLSNFFAGFYLNVDRPIRVGDFVRLENGDEGFVEEIGWRSSKVRVLANNLVVIPNSRLAQSIITDYDRPTKDMGLVIPVGVSYDSDLEKVERITVEIARDILAKTQGGVKDFQPFIRYNAFGDSNINFSAILRVQSAVDRYLVTHEFIKALKKRYDEEGIEISYPARKVYIKEGAYKN